MTRLHPLSPWFVLALLLLLVAVAAALWLRGALSVGEAYTSPVRPSPHGSVGASPLLTPSVAAADRSSAWSSAGMSLLWVVLGCVLALGVASFILRQRRHDA